MTFVLRHLPRSGDLSIFLFRFKGDGKERGKLGIPPKRSMGIADSGTLTLVWMPQQCNG